MPRVPLRKLLLRQRMRRAGQIKLQQRADARQVAALMLDFAAAPAVVGGGSVSGSGGDDDDDALNDTVEVGGAEGEEFADGDAAEGEGEGAVAAGSDGDDLVAAAVVAGLEAGQAAWPPLGDAPRRRRGAAAAAAPAQHAAAPLEAMVHDSGRATLSTTSSQLDEAPEEDDDSGIAGSARRAAGVTDTWRAASPLHAVAAEVPLAERATGEARASRGSMPRTGSMTRGSPGGGGVATPPASPAAALGASMTPLRPSARHAHDGHSTPSLYYRAAAGGGVEAEERDVGVARAASAAFAIAGQVLGGLLSSQGVDPASAVAAAAMTAGAATLTPSRRVPPGKRERVASLSGSEELAGARTPRRAQHAIKVDPGGGGAGGAGMVPAVVAALDEGLLSTVGGGGMAAGRPLLLVAHSPPRAAAAAAVAADEDDSSRRSMTAPAPVLKPPTAGGVFTPPPPALARLGHTGGGSGTGPLDCLHSPTAPPTATAAAPATDSLPRHHLDGDEGGVHGGDGGDAGGSPFQLAACSAAKRRAGGASLANAAPQRALSFDDSSGSASASASASANSVVSLRADDDADADADVAPTA